MLVLHIALRIASTEHVGDGEGQPTSAPPPPINVLDLEDVTEIFARLNSAGTKVSEADIALALAASQNSGWARQHVLPFLQKLEEAGFELDPNLAFRSCGGIGLGRARLKKVPRPPREAGPAGGTPRRPASHLGDSRRGGPPRGDPAAGRYERRPIPSRTADRLRGAESYPYRQATLRAPANSW